MESNRRDNLKALNEETGKQELVIDDLGTSRSYQCVFCKRGFTTAQALGGHMNIHRRDRARNKKPIVPSIPNPFMEDYTRPGLLHQFPSHSQFYSAPMERQRNYQMNFTPPTSSTGYPHGYHTDYLNIPQPRPLRVTEDDWRASLSLRIGPTDIEDKEDEEDEEDDDEEEEEEDEDELDLELRLGHDP